MLGQDSTMISTKPVFPARGRTPSMICTVQRQKSIFIASLRTSQRTLIRSVKSFRNRGRSQFRIASGSDLIGRPCCERAMEATLNTFVFLARTTTEETSDPVSKIDQKGRLAAGGFFYVVPLADAPRGKIVKFDLNKTPTAANRPWS